MVSHFQLKIQICFRKETIATQRIRSLESEKLESERHSNTESDEKNMSQALAMQWEESDG